MLVSSDGQMKKSSLSVCQCAASAWMRNPLKSNRLAKPSKYQGKAVPTVVSLTTVWALLWVEEISHNQSRRKKTCGNPSGLRKAAVLLHVKRERWQDCPVLWQYWKRSPQVRAKATWLNQKYGSNIMLCVKTSLLHFIHRQPKRKDSLLQHGCSLHPWRISRS